MPEPTALLGGKADAFSLRAEVRATLALAGPISLTMIGIMVIETTDVLMIGRLGEEALAAGALAVTLWAAFLLFGMGVLNAVPSLISQAIGRDDTRGVRRTTRQGLWAGTVLGVPSALLLSFFGESALVAMGQEPRLAAAAQDYLNYLAWALLPIMWTVGMRLTMAAYEVTAPALIGVVVSIPVNAFLNWLFIFGALGFPEMGLAGAGFSTLLVDGVFCIGMGLYLARVEPFKSLELFRNFARPDWQRFRKVFKVGLPGGGMSVLENSLFSASTVMMGWVGVTELAAHNISFQVISILFMVPFGLSQAATIRLARAAGQGDLDLVRRRGWTLLGMTAVIMTCSATIIFLGRDHFVGLFVGSDDPARDGIVAAGAVFLGIAVIFQLFDGLQIVATGILRGLNDTYMPMVIGGFCYILIGALSAYVFAFPLALKGTGIWLGLLAGLVASAILLIARFKAAVGSRERAFAQLD